MEDKIIGIISIIVTAFLSYIAGIKIYFKQKEYELVKKRYLEEGLDILIENVETALSLFRSNWAYSVYLLKEFKSLEKSIPRESYTGRFPQFDERIFRVRPLSRLRYLINDKIYYDAIQQLYAFVENSIAYFRIDLSNSIRLYCDTNRALKSHEEIAEIYLKEIKKIEKNSHNYYELLGSLFQLSLFIEREKFSFKQLEKFRDIEDVRTIVSNFKNNFVLKSKN